MYTCTCTCMYNVKCFSQSSEKRGWQYQKRDHIKGIETRKEGLANPLWVKPCYSPTLEAMRKACIITLLIILTILHVHVCQMYICQYVNLSIFNHSVYTCTCTKGYMHTNKFPNMVSLLLITLDIHS